MSKPTLHHHTLTGCAPAPLAHYLKALGILRLIAEQKDPKVRGWWQDEAFHLVTTLDAAGIEKFFLEEYRPTPMFNPWGARSGFYSGSSEKTSRISLQNIEKSTAPRLETFRAAIQIVRKILSDSFSNTKPDSAAEKNRLVRLLRQSVPINSSVWLDSCIACLGEGLAPPAIFGTGFSEGSGSYAASYMAAVQKTVIDCTYDETLATVLWGNPIPHATWNETFGHFLPTGHGGPWELLLAFEGICLIRSAVTATSRSGSSKWMSSPFYVAPVAAAYATSTPQDEVAMNKGKKLPGRGEQWFPIWKSPLGASELQTIFSQGRISIQRKTARSGAAAALAIANLGVQRGINNFIRYGYQQRNNLATHFAVPLGKCPVHGSRKPAVEGLSDIHPWLDRLRHALRKAKQPPADIEFSERQASALSMSIIDTPDNPNLWQSLLLALGDIESQLIRRSSFTINKPNKPLCPIPRISPSWIVAANDNSAEFRLAVSLSLQTTDAIGQDSIRRHWLPTDDTGRTFATDASGIRRDPRVVCHALDPVRDLNALVQRRAIECAKENTRYFALNGHPSFYAHPADLSALLSGTLDLQKLTRLSRAFLAIDRKKLTTASITFAPPANCGEVPPPIYGIFRLTCLPSPLIRGASEITIPFDPAIPARLATGDLATAGAAALRRLRASGLRPVIRQVAGTTDLARRLALSLAFPISIGTASRLADSVTKPQLADTNYEA
jgi:CRISPR-associated protein Csx17